MDKIEISMEKCRGIVKLNAEFLFNSSKRSGNVHVIYAKNGNGKSSFSKSIDEHKDPVAKIPSHLAHQNIEPLCSVKLNGVDVANNDIFVGSWDYQLAEYRTDVSNLVTDPELKAEYDLHYAKIANSKNALMKALSKIVYESEDENKILQTKEELRKVFGVENEFELNTLLSGGDFVKEVDKASSFFSENIKYRIISDEKLLKKLGDNQTYLQNYYNEIDILLRESGFIRGKFGPSGADKVSKELSGEGYFEVGHKLLLSMNDGKEEISDEKDIKLRLDNVYDKISERKNFQKIDSFLREKQFTEFKNLLLFDHTTKQNLIEYARDPNSMLKNAWYSYMATEKEILLNFKREYTENINKVREVIDKANDIDRKNLWFDIVKDFKERFNNYRVTPYITKTTNTVLGIETPIIAFKYLPRGSEENKVINPKILSDTLSTGERKIYNVLDLIFKVKSAENDANKQLIILDDFIDSFDYQNKYTLMLYLLEISVNSNVLLILLTHNFDLYRLACSRLYNPKEEMMKTNWWQMVMLNDATVELKVGPDIKLITDALTNREDSSIVKIAFFAGLCRETLNIKRLSSKCSTNCKVKNHVYCKDYELLSEALHVRNNSPSIGQVIDVLNKNLGTNFSKPGVANPEPTFRELCLESANKVDKEDDNLESKFILAIASRITQELVISKILTANGGAGNDISGYIVYCQKNNVHPSSAITRVSISSPEHIHINSFMYEPLIDVGIDELIGTYTGIKGELAKITDSV